MKKKIIFLHTSKLHVDRFTKIVNEVSNMFSVDHYVNEELLTVAQKTGKVDKEGFIKEVNRIRQEESGCIVCTCSTYGELCDEKNNIYRIDKPIGVYLASNFSKIGIAYTLNSTKEISKKLIEKIAQDNRRSIRITEIDCSDSWSWFKHGDIEKYEVEIARQIKIKSDNAEVVFLAQASMEGAKKYLNNEIYQVVSSPEIGVREYLERIKKKAVPSSR